MSSAILRVTHATTTSRRWNQNNPSSVSPLLVFSFGLPAPTTPNRANTSRCAFAVFPTVLVLSLVALVLLLAAILVFRTDDDDAPAP
ncbi:MAG: hypothetical protein LBV28_00495, partial [Puniceicoccales bacterium]|nr:hypothetical protein [Puniceicoccales bacterium]